MVEVRRARMMDRLVVRQLGEAVRAETAKAIADRHIPCPGEGRKQ
jgi:hypothetical protein